MEKKEEKKEINLQAEFKITMKSMMESIAARNPRKVEELAEIYELVGSYQADPENYMDKEIPIDYYVETQKNENWFQRHMKNIESLGEKVKGSISEGIDKITDAFK